jgi:peptidoglycan hydrolase-like protein with peptidoglycan-binding domain
VQDFQRQRQLPSTGVADAATAQALLAAIDEASMGKGIEASDTVPLQPQTSAQQQQQLQHASASESAVRLHDMLGQLGFPLPDAEVGRTLLGPATQQALQQFQRQYGLPVRGALDALTTAALNAALAALPAAKLKPPDTASPSAEADASPGAGAAPPPPPGTGKPEESSAYHLQGRLTLDYGLPAAGVTVRLYHIGFGGQDRMLGATTSDSQGQYGLAYALPQGQQPNLQVRVLDPHGHEVTLSATKFNAQSQEALNLVVPARVRPLAPEFERLAADMDRHIGGIGQLAQAQETASRQDLTLLSAATHWDARLLALAASAARQTLTSGLGQEVLYALFRAGLPTDPEHLAMAPAATVRHALTKASQANIVDMNEQQVSAATTAFETFALKTRLAAVAPGALSSFGELLSAVVPDPAQQTAFAQLFFSQPQVDASLWRQAADRGIPPRTLDALKLQGKFLYLTFNNAPLSQKLQQEIGSLDNLSQLADKDYYDSATWKRALAALAGTSNGSALDRLIPPAYGGATTADRLEAYTADLARKVRVSFPTQVTARMIEKRELAVDQATAGNVTAFLRAAAARGYELGRTPLNIFLKSLSAATPAPPTTSTTYSPGMLPHLMGQAFGSPSTQSSSSSSPSSSSRMPMLDEASTRSLKTLHRLYQVTPSTASLRTVLRLGFTSAQDIAAHTRDDFMNKFASAFPSPGEAALVYAKAQQISAVTFNALVMARLVDATPAVYGLSGAAGDRQQARDAIARRFPAMAGLLGTNDSHTA